MHVSRIGSRISSHSRRKSFRNNRIATVDKFLHTIAEEQTDVSSINDSSVTTQSVKSDDFKNHYFLHSATMEHQEQEQESWVVDKHKEHQQKLEKLRKQEIFMESNENNMTETEAESQNMNEAPQKIKGSEINIKKAVLHVSYYPNVTYNLFTFEFSDVWHIQKK